MDTGDELRLREIQREYLDFLDDDVSHRDFNFWQSLAKLNY